MHGSGPRPGGGADGRCLGVHVRGHGAALPAPHQRLALRWPSTPMQSITRVLIVYDRLIVILDFDICCCPKTHTIALARNGNRLSLGRLGTDAVRWVRGAAC